MPRIPRRRRSVEHPAAGSPSVDDLVRENARLERDNIRLRGRIGELEERIGKLEELIERLRRASCRQAAPHSRNAPKRNPHRPGRKPGDAYGTHAARAVPERVDREVAVPLPSACPGCGGQTVLDRVAEQYQEDLPVVVPVVTRFAIEVGHCTGCGTRVQGRAAEQTSDALGAAAVQIGPRAIALAAHLNKALGIPHGKCAEILERIGGLGVSAAGLARALHRAAGAATPTYDAIRETVSASPVVSPDETGWRVGGKSAWLWAAATEQATCYQVAAGRGFAEAAALLGEDFSGVLCRDGWAPYRRFEDATHQTCLAHLLRRCTEMIEVAERGQARVPHAVKRILKDALALRGERDVGQITPRALRRRIAAFERRVEALMAGRVRHEPNVRLLRHLARERDALFTFLKIEGVDATNWRSEQAIRPGVVARKHWGGNVSWRGARTFEVLASVLRTCRQQGADAIDVLVDLLRQQRPGVTPMLHLRGG